MIEIKKGKQAQPVRALIYGPEGGGKSSLGSCAPSPLFIDVERGSSHIDVERVEPENMKELNEVLKFVRTGEHDYKSLVIDTIDWTEKLISRDICERHRVDSIEKVEGGFGKGFTMLEEEMMNFLNGLDQVRRERGIHIVLLGHSKIQKHEDPELAASYDRYQLDMAKKTGPVVKAWVDALLFYNFKTQVTDRTGSMNSKRGVGGKERILHTNRTAAYDAKNRFELPDSIPVKEQFAIPAELEVIFASNSKETAPAGPKSDAGEGGVEGADGAGVNPRLKALVADFKSADIQHEMTKIIKAAGGANDVNQFLATRGKDLSTIDDAYRMRIIDGMEQFIAQVQAFKKEQEEAS